MSIKGMGYGKEDCSAFGQLPDTGKKPKQKQRSWEERSKKTMRERLQPGL
jgi:hypothetical protein